MKNSFINDLLSNSMVNSQFPYLDNRPMLLLTRTIKLLGILNAFYQMFAVQFEFSDKFTLKSTLVFSDIIFRMICLVTFFIEKQQEINKKLKSDLIFMSFIDHDSLSQFLYWSSSS